MSVAGSILRLGAHLQFLQQYILRWKIALRRGIEVLHRPVAWSAARIDQRIIRAASNHPVQ
jgi:hypothetical protein